MMFLYQPRYFWFSIGYLRAIAVRLPYFVANCTSDIVSRNPMQG
jgi:hypothetical protein